MTIKASSPTKFRWKNEESGIYRLINSTFRTLLLDSCFSDEFRFLLLDTNHWVHVWESSRESWIFSCWRRWGSRFREHFHSIHFIPTSVGNFHRCPRVYLHVRRFRSRASVYVYDVFWCSWIFCEQKSAHCHQARIVSDGIKEHDYEFQLFQIPP